MSRNYNSVWEKKKKKSAEQASEARLLRQKL